MCAASCNPLGHKYPDPNEELEIAQNGPTTNLSHLTRRQILALPILAAAPTMTQAARDAGISESTFYRWRQDEHFRNELQRLTVETADLTRQELETLSRQSSQVLSDLMQDPDPMVRLRAARAVAVMGVQVSEAHTQHQDARKINRRVSATSEWKGKRPASTAPSLNTGLSRRPH